MSETKRNNDWVAGLAEEAKKFHQNETFAHISRVGVIS